MKKWISLLCLCLLLQSLSGCMLSTVNDLPKKEETIAAFKEHQDLFLAAVEELQLLWKEQAPESISVSLTHTGVCAKAYHLTGEGRQLRMTELELESETLRQLLNETVEYGIHMDENGIDFECAGAGFGPNTTYSGVFYTATENIRDLPFFPHRAESLIDEDYLSTGTGGDNEVEIERIEAGFFYYRRRY